MFGVYMNISDIKRIIKYHEGEKLTVYKDTLGYLTVGVGHLLLKKDGVYHVGDVITQSKSDEWFESDVNNAIAVAKHFLGDNLYKLSVNRQLVIVDMCFNLGSKIESFKTFKASLLLDRYDLACTSMQNSLWYKQVGRRGVNLVAIMRTDLLTAS